jgi:hypothetical protein
VTDPEPSPLKSPELETLATELFDDPQLISLPLKGSPVESLGTAMSCTVWPTIRFVTDGVIEMVAADLALTITAVLATLPSTTAATVAVPAATAVTSPVAEILATVGVALLQVTARPVSTAPAAS